MAEPATAVHDDGGTPDIMNDPQYATNTVGGEDGSGDADTCRICRGEETDSEPLFHPCKCSGSIKFVHQDCLMEWLSHSQKKHCELCKTAFRFTKLYSPNMPQSLPFRVLVWHLAVHSVKNITTWLRFCLVVTVWLGALPYIIRQVWRLLFWLSDGGWPPDYLMMKTVENATTIQAYGEARELQLASLIGNGTSPATPFQAIETSSASMGAIVDRLIGYLMPISQTLNVSGADPLATGLFKSLYYGFGLQSVAVPEGLVSNASVYVTNPSTISLNPSLLSEISFLRNLTRNSYINQLIITIAEGYIITILVVVCFILVFLIREWVVQQQPGINMGAGFNAEFAAPQRPREEPQAREPRPEVLNERRDPAQRPLARVRRRHNHLDGADDAAPAHDNQEGRRDSGTELNSGDQGRTGHIRNAQEPASEIQRGIADEPRMAEEFLNIWRRADGDPEEVLRIIEREDKGDQLRYWVNAMKLLQNPESSARPPPSTRNSIGEGASKAHSTIAEPPSPKFAAESSEQGTSEKSTGSSESWQDIPDLLPGSGYETDIESLKSNLEAEDGPMHKGKAVSEASNVDQRSRIRLYPSSEESSRLSSLDDPRSKSPPSLTSTASRPRAISDGPPLKESKSPLANNNWSFSNLPEDEEDIQPHPFSWTEEKQKKFERDARALAGIGNFAESSSQANQPNESNQAWKAAQGKGVGNAVDQGTETHTVVQQPQTPRIIAPDDPVLQGDTPEDENGPVRVRGQDGVWREYDNWDHIIEAAVPNDPEPNPFRPEVPLPVEREPIAARLPEPQGLVGAIADFLWGGVGGDRDYEEPGPNDEHIVQDLAAEAPFVPVAPHNGFEQGGFAEQDREVVQAAIAAGLDPNDPDAIDDAEDFEGIMELVGMRGPIFSLLQNALFSAFLLALTVAFGVWIPYNLGRITLLLIGNPGPAFKLPLRFIFGSAAFMQDFGLTILGGLSYFAIRMLLLPFNMLSGYITAIGISPYSMVGPDLADAAMQLSFAAFNRIMDGPLNSILNFPDSEIFAFSAASHESLIMIQNLIINSLAGLGATVVYLFTGDYHISTASFLAMIRIPSHLAWNFLRALPAWLARPDSWVISLEMGKRTAPLDLQLSVWGGTDRFWAVVVGYAALSFVGALYVRKGSPFSAGNAGREWEATIIDLLNQAGGVMKVILIISIEMLVFPLYCGLLLDAALLPLFENTTIMSRLLFTVKSPLTSIFVHWFVGTCYMFHFALFVSMCRKIMRKGVLYFIRDPDDPTFHPVRDVLERNVATQLRKILFSALVYGGLVVICLGGVVWGLAFAFRGVLPIHWSSNEPVLEFPIDLLFYNFLMPLAVKFFKPSDGLHAMYSWWFRQCARMLRLTWFMFDERKEDEEGYNVRRSLLDILRRAKGDPFTPIEVSSPDEVWAAQPDWRAYFVRDGRYVRAPASDQVRIPKGTQIFLEVDLSNKRLDGRPDQPDGIHGSQSDLCKLVYVPPWFRLRIFLFIIFIWLFAALTGVCITIVPLVFGRSVFAKIIPPHVRKNDVYAFSIGIYILGSALYLVLHAKKFIYYLRNAVAVDASTPHNVIRRVVSITSQVASIGWTYAAFLIILPTLFAFLIEFYFIVPIHTYFAVEERHVVHFVQSWTLGLLYVKLTTRLILWHENSRPARALRNITRDGYLHPDARLATRSFILPAVLALSVALFYPWALARLVVMTILKNSPEKHLLAYRYSYPMCLCACCIGAALWVLTGWVKEWRMKIRDEVYLIGERLHDFGERKVASSGAIMLRPSVVR